MPLPAAGPEPVGPVLTGSGGWTGVDAPVAMSALRGRVVVVLFWTASDIAGLRVIEELRRLDHHHGEEVVVIAVHTGRWPAEADHRSVLLAVERHRLNVPVLDDPDGATAESIGVAHWPTVVLVDQRGQVVDRFVGEGHSVSLGRAVARLLDADPRRRRRLPLNPPPTVPDPLAFPAKVAASPDGRRLAIADTGHDRVVVCTLDGLVLEVYTGFVQPHGVRFDGRGVVVCDTVPGRIVRSNGEVLADAIASPWDLVAASDGSWVVAEAGGHRLVRVRPGEITTRVAAGTGAEGMVDGEDVQAELSQPSGVARTPEGIVFVDAGTGALRRLRRERRSGDVVTLSAAGPLHHPRGVAASAEGGPVYVADTLNSRIVVWEDGRLRDLGITGLDEPGGLDVMSDGRLVVADTNNHRVVLVDPAGATMVEVELDETWVHAAPGAPVAGTTAQSVTVPVAMELVDEETDGPWLVAVDARPVDLLAGGAHDVEMAAGDTLELGAGRPGEGLLLVAVTAGIGKGRRRIERVQRWRHRFTVSAP